ncbi:MAG: hypothetical protein HKN32_09855 [Flavobacteriales bacterium]|nr:hypothetical protein [Flavobacteriales bacterium]
MRELSVAEGNSEVGTLRIAEAIMPAMAQMTMPLSKEYTLEIMDLDSAEAKVTVDGRSLKNVSKRGKLKSQSSPWSFDIDSLNRATLTIGSFSWGKDGTYFKFLNKSFKAIDAANCEVLVIDIRDNTGGSSERMEAVFDHIQLQPINVPTNIIAKQSELSKDRYARTFRGLSRFVLKTFMKGNEDVRNYIAMAEMEIGNSDTLFYKHRREPSKHRFKGEVYVLMNGRTGSAAANFAAAFKKHELGTLVGEPCLGPMSGTWGNAVDYTLPKSKVRIHISSIRFNVDNTFSRDPISVQPDHFIETSRRDLIDGVDTVKEFALQLSQDQ